MFPECMHYAKIMQIMQVSENYANYASPTLLMSASPAPAHSTGTTHTHTYTHRPPLNSDVFDRGLG